MIALVDSADELFTMPLYFDRIVFDCNALRQQFKPLGTLGNEPTRDDDYTRALSEKRALCEKRALSHEQALSIRPECGNPA